MFLLVRAIKGLTFKFNGPKHLLHAPHDSKRDFYQYYYTGYTTNPQYLKTFNNKVLVIDSYGGAIGTDLELSKY